MKKINSVRSFTLITIVFCSLISMAQNTVAATFTISNTNDSGVGSLRQAITDINSNSVSTDNTIVFDPTVFNAAQTITLTSGELAISGNGVVSIQGPGANLLTISGNNQSRIFFINTNGKAVLTGLTITKGNTTGRGAAIQNWGMLTLNNSIITANSTTFDGGGISNELGILTISNSVINGNNALNGLGGGIFTSGTGNKLTINNTIIANNAAMQGAGIFNGYTAVATITNSTVSNNTANGNGGGIDNNVNSTLNLINSTISGNSALGSSGIGGGINNNSVLNLTSSTVANNMSENDGGGIINQLSSFAKVSAYNTIIADNISQKFGSSDYTGTLVSQGYNLIENISRITISGITIGNILGIDPKLQPLGNNGGMTLTHAISQASPAFNAGNNQNAPTTDQRGLNRIVGGSIDIGSYELQTLSCTFTLSLNNITVSSNGGTGNFDVESNSGCNEAFSAVSNSSWLIVTSGATGTGRGTVSFSVQPNTGVARQGSIIVAGQVFTVYQLAAVQLTTIRGRIVDTQGKNARNALIEITDTLTGESRILIPNPFGYFFIRDVQVGRFFKIVINHKRLKYYEQTMRADDVNNSWTFVAHN